MRLQSASEHPHGLSDRDYDALFTTDKHIIFAFHGYPSLIHRLTYRRTNRNLHVRGYNEESTITTAFDMRSAEPVGPFSPRRGRHRPAAPARRDLRLPEAGDGRQTREHNRYINTHGQDLPESATGPGTFRNEHRHQPLHQGPRTSVPRWRPAPTMTTPSTWPSWPAWTATTRWRATRSPTSSRSTRCAKRTEAAVTGPDGQHVQGHQGRAAGDHETGRQQRGRSKPARTRRSAISRPAASGRWASPAPTATAPGSSSACCRCPTPRARTLQSTIATARQLGVHRQDGHRGPGCHRAGNRADAGHGHRHPGRLRPRVTPSARRSPAAAEAIENADGFAQVFPEHKYHIVDVLQKRGHIVGMTGDGVNDAPALKKADCGIAVSGATDAARAAASIVLMKAGPVGDHRRGQGKPPDRAADEQLRDLPHRRDAAGPAVRHPGHPDLQLLSRHRHHDRDPRRCSTTAPSCRSPTTTCITPEPEAWNMRTSLTQTRTGG